MAQSNDQTLLQQYAADGSQDAFAQLVDRHIDLVHTAARRMVHGDSHLAEDVTQAVFILLARRAGQIKPNVVLAGWLYNATRLSASVALRGQRRRQRHETAAASEALRMRSSNSSQRAGDSPAPSWDQLETVIDDAMGKLSTADRDAIALRFFQNKTMAEAGAAMGITEDAAKMRVTRAVTRLRNTLARAGVTAAPVPALMVVMSAAVPNAAPAGLAQATMAAALAAIGTAAGKAGGSYAIAKGTSAMMTWIKIKLTLATAAVVMAVVGTGAAVVAQTLLKAHEAPSPAVQVVAATPSTPAIPIATPAGAEATAPPAPLTLNLDGVDPRTAIAMIAKISGTKIDIWPDTAWNPQFMGFGKAMPKVTLHADNQPFWSVLRDFCQQAGARVQEMGNRANTVTIAADDNGSFSRLPAFVGPTHMVVLNSISRSNSVRFDQDRSIHEDRGGSFDVWIDPRVNVLKASHGVWIESAVDENGKSLVVPHDPAWDEFYMGGFSPWHLSLNFPLNYDWTQSKTLKQ
ncbi:MAG TPA: sigma-70 family RNA polymerase sigma factor, partial [Tepidisphaeraceae bacterium]|nr:sigma-70 family RNA polymerase sigma factor [Tepidisphaeraceae bacterium]